MYNLLLSIISLVYFSDIYSYSLPGINGAAPINFSDYRGKKILIVNTASNSSFSAQYAGLEQLYQQYKDSLVVIACPSNDFGHESADEATIRQSVQNTYHIHFLLAGKTTVSGAGQNSLYSWLTTGTQNGSMTHAVTTDFQKYLISSDGHMVGYFAGAMDPLDSTIVNMIR